MAHRAGPVTAVRLGLALLGLSACRPQSVTGADQTVTTGTPDQIATATSMALNDPNGLRQALVTADTALVFQQSQRIEFRRIKVTVFDQRSDQASVLTAKRGIYSILSGTIEAVGEVTVTTDRKGRLTTPRLVFDPRRLEYRNDTTYVYDGGPGTAVISGRKLSTDVRLSAVRGNKT